MPKILIFYYSKTGNTEKMAKLIAEGVVKGGVKADVRRVQYAAVEELLDYDGIISGSPTYYGSMAWEIKKFIDGTLKLHGKLDGKVGGAFTSAANIGGGNETAILDMLNAWIIHGLIVQGDPKGDHYGRVSIGAPDERVETQCRRMGERYAELAKKVAK
jgi:NAD(P)H dehydrogenase (quinone)